MLPHEYFAPDLLFAEIANAIWKKIRRGELTTSKSEAVTSPRPLKQV